jgi:hypothetical protein
VTDQSEEKRRVGRPKGSGAKGGHRVTGRVTERGFRALNAEAATTGTDRSDVIGDLAERLADQHEQLKNGEPT